MPPLVYVVRRGVKEAEAQVVDRLVAANPGPLTSEHVAGIFRQVMAACMSLEQKLA